MSGADEDEEAGPPGLPPGTPFYITPAGAAVAGQNVPDNLTHGSAPLSTIALPRLKRHLSTPFRVN